MRASPVRHGKAHRESLQIVARRAPLPSVSRTGVPLIGAASSRGILERARTLVRRAPFGLADRIGLLERRAHAGRIEIAGVDGRGGLLAPRIVDLAGIDSIEADL